MGLINKKLSSGIVFIFLIPLLFGSCHKRPANILPEDKMVSLMADMEITEAYVNQQPSISSEDRIDLGRRVLLAHNVSEETLDTTLAWYGRNLDEYTTLFEKVDKEIKRRKDIYIENNNISSDNGTNLWPYSSHMEVSPLSGNDVIVFSLEEPEIEKGDFLKLYMVNSSLTNAKGLLGLEYSDGGGEAVTSNFNNKKTFQIELQSDTSRSISRLYGMIYFKDLKTKPFYIDSISLTRQPLDTASYKQNKRSQKTYGVKRNRVIEKKDTILSDSIPITPIDSLNNIKDLSEDDNTPHLVRRGSRPMNHNNSRN